MNLKRKHAIGLLAALLVLVFFVVALVVHPPSMKTVFSVLSLASFLAGVVTVTYEYPVAGVTAPTSSQVNAPALGEVTAIVNMADGDTSAVITHNFGDPAYGPTDTSKGFPQILGYYINAGTGPVVVSWTVTNTTATLNKASSAGSGGTFQVAILRPHTRMR